MTVAVPVTVTIVVTVTCYFVTLLHTLLLTLLLLLPVTVTILLQFFTLTNLARRTKNAELTNNHGIDFSLSTPPPIAADGE